MPFAACPCVTLAVRLSSVQAKSVLPVVLALAARHGHPLRLRPAGGCLHCVQPLLLLPLLLLLLSVVVAVLLLLPPIAVALPQMQMCQGGWTACRPAPGAALSSVGSWSMHGVDACFTCILPPCSCARTQVMQCGPPFGCSLRTTSTPHAAAAALMEAGPHQGEPACTGPQARVHAGASLSGPVVMGGQP